MMSVSGGTTRPVTFAPISAPTSHFRSHLVPFPLPSPISAATRDIRPPAPHRDVDPDAVAEGRERFGRMVGGREAPPLVPCAGKNGGMFGYGEVGLCLSANHTLCWVVSKCPSSDSD